MAIIGEPTEMRIGLAHRGFHGHRTTFRGCPAHSGDLQLGTGAIEPASTLVAGCLPRHPEVDVAQTDAFSQRESRMRQTLAIEC
ncbi:MAG: hypothetical protein V4636_08255 [Pseudomonadota bacterium]